MNKVFTSWSGGKDSCLAMHRAVAGGLHTSHLINTITEDGKRSRSHGLSSEILQLQAQAVKIPLVQVPTTTTNYEAEFKKAILGLKNEGITGGIFGDIDFNEHRKWVERVCHDTDIVPYLPLWDDSQDRIMREFIDSGFKAIVVAARADIFGDDTLGRWVDLDFLNYLESLRGEKGLTLCGEAGEYHTLVVDGPLFKERIEITESRKVLRDERWFLEILNAELRIK